MLLVGLSTAGCSGGGGGGAMPALAATMRPSAPGPDAIAAPPALATPAGPGSSPATPTMPVGTPAPNAAPVTIGAVPPEPAPNPPAIGSAQPVASAPTASALLPITTPPIAAAAATPPATVSLTIAVDLSNAASSASTRRRSFAAGPGLPQSARIVAQITGGSMSSVADCRICVVVISVPLGPVSIVATSYDRPAATGNALGSARVSTIAGGGSASITLAEWRPIVASVSFAVNAAFIDGVAGSTTVTAAAYDADGNPIGGSAPFASAISLALNDPAHAFTLSTTSLASAVQLLEIGYDGTPGARSMLVPSLPNVALAPIALPVDPPAFTVRAHTKTIDYEYGTPAQYNAAFGFTHWAAARPWLDLAITPPGTVTNLVRAGGIMTAAYLDVNLCSGSFAAGANVFAHPDCGSLPRDAFYSQDGHPDRPLTTSYNGIVVQRVGNPQSQSLQRAALDAVNGELAGSNDDAVQLDDAGTPSEIYMPLCYGLGRLSGGSYSCDGSPGGAASYPFDSTYSAAGWVAGMTALANALPRPAIVNGLAGSDPHLGHSPAADVILATPASWGGLCETCFYSTNPYVVTGAVLDSQLAGSMAVTAAGKNVAVLNGGGLDPVQRERALADIMLFYDADRTWIGGGPCGGASMIHECPEQALTFYEPVRAYPTTPAAVRQPGGSYAREFRACFANGKPLGPCAAVVNPDRDVPHPLPALTRTYAHTLTMSGDSLCACYGTSGSVAPNGAAPPASLPGTSGYVLFK